MLTASLNVDTLYSILQGQQWKNTKYKMCIMLVYNHVNSFTKCGHYIKHSSSKTMENTKSKMYIVFVNNIVNSLSKCGHSL